MAKVADKYFITDPWNIIEEGFNPDYSLVSESIFSLGNEYMGVRGYFEEGYAQDRLLGSYFNGIYETMKTEGSAYKGIIDHTEFIVNSLDWLYLQLFVDGEEIVPKSSNIREFKRKLDLKSGILTRSYIYVLEDGRKLRLEFERFLSMQEASQAAQRVTLTPINFSGTAKLVSGLDFTTIHKAAGKNFWNYREIGYGTGWCSILADTIHTNQSVFSVCRFETEAEAEKEYREEKKALKEFTLRLTQGEKAVFTKMIINVVRKGQTLENLEEFNVKCNNAQKSISSLTYEGIKAGTIAWWDKRWNDSDIVIDGDEVNQQGIRYCIFQLHQTYHGADSKTIIGAKGLTGEAYSGNTFWDTETYCLPFYIFNNAEAAKHLLEFRYLTLNEAKERAKALDCNGAFYPIATISGRECCSLWQHASIQLQVSTAVAYAIWHYERITKDEAFVFEKGVRVLIEISRMLASRGAWNASHTRYGFYGVMGPDEFQMMVNNNCYTNFMAKATLEYTLDVLARLKKSDGAAFGELERIYSLSTAETMEWKIFAEKMFIPYAAATMLFEQHEGYFNLPHIEVNLIPREDFPLYHHWSYDRIYRNDMIKQPDVLMMMLLYNGCFSEEQLRANYEFYEPKCIHESSLSPSVHSILAVQLQKHEEAYRFFGFATRMDLDNYNRNTAEGLHTTSIAAAWMNIVYGFAGMRSDRELLSFTPSIPKDWNGYSFCIHYQNDLIRIKITKTQAFFFTEGGTEIPVRIYGETVYLGKEKTAIKIPEEWKG